MDFRCQAIIRIGSVAVAGAVAVRITLECFGVRSLFAQMLVQTSTMGWVFRSQGQTDLQFRWAIVAGLIAVLCVAIGVQRDVLGVAVAYVPHSYLLWYHGITIPGRLIGLDFREFLANPALEGSLETGSGVDYTQG